MRFFCATLVLSALVMTGCAGDQPGAQEPTAAAKADDSAPKVPDMPGGSGETKDKPAGEGQAAPAAPAAPAATPPAVEKSQPDPAAAAKAVQSVKSAPALKAGDATVDIGALNVRSGGGSKNPVKRVVKKGEKVTIKECKAGWCQVGDGEWVSARYLKQ